MTLGNSRLTLLAAIITGLSFLAVACSSGAEQTPFPTCAGTPFAFPHIFGGEFTVDDEPGPQGVPMFATLGGCRGPFNESVRAGEYVNVAISAQSDDDFGGEVEFYLGNPDGPFIKADQTAIYERSSQPQFIDLDLTFPRLP